jgi:F-type H+-transporting ATPase subunit gamma
MQMIAAVKMRRAQEQVLASRPYAEKAWEVLIHLADQPGAKEQLHPLLTQRPVDKICIILMTSDRGLAGGYNTNIIRKTVEFIKEFEKPVSLITVGRKGRVFFARSRREIIAEFSNMPDTLALIDVLPIAQIAIADFLEGNFDEVYLAYTHFVNTIVQRPVVKRLLPLIPKQLEEQAVSEYVSETKRTMAKTYIYEPGPAKILDTILPRFTELQVYQAMLEALASEYSARMVAMRSATDNANELVADLTLTYNRARQEAITMEMMDIVGGAEVLR